MARRFKGGGRKFIQLFANVKRSQAYHDLDVYARAALIELLDRYTGINNGMIGLGCRELSKALKCSQATALRAMRALDDSGLARPLTPGRWRGKKATEWRLMFYRCDKTGELPVNNWPQAQFATESAKGSVGKRKPSLSSPREAQMPKSSMNGFPLSSPGSAHIDIYHRPPDLDGGTEAPPWETPWKSSQSSGGVRGCESPL